MTTAYEPAESSITHLVATFLTDLANAHRSAHTQRGYATDLRTFTIFHPGPLATVTPAVLRAYFTQRGHLQVTSRARMQAVLTSFFTWAVRQGQLAQNPMALVQRVTIETPPPRPKPRQQVEAIFAAIPKQHRRDKLLFKLMFELGLRISEALTLYVEDVSLDHDNERITVVGKGNKRRTLLLDDPTLVKDLRTHLQHTGYTHGLLFRATKNGDGGPLRYQTMQERWAGYCATAGIACTLHQLRHSHASELVLDGVSLATVRKRLGHVSIQSTLRYAEQADGTSDAELRAWRRAKQR